MRIALAFVLLAACGGGGSEPPTGPAVWSLMPQSGPWGTAVTIDGARFGTAMTGTVAFDGQIGAAGFVVDSWYDTEIKGRIAFPASGAITIQTARGETAAGTFTTDQPWAPSAAYDVAQVSDQLVLSTGDMAALFHQYEVGNVPALAIFSGGQSGTYPLSWLCVPSDSSASLPARIVEADDHTAEVIATRNDETVAVLNVQGGSIVTTPTGLTGTVLAASRDATGVYVWLDTGSMIERARPGATWTVDRGPFARPLTPLDAAVAADGTLWLTVSEPGAGNSAFVALQVLAPSDVQLGAPEHVDPTSYSGTIMQAHPVVAADGVHGVVLATASSGSAEVALPARVRSGSSTWTDAPAIAGLVQFAYAGSTLGALVNDADAKTTSLMPDVTAPTQMQVIPVWPMQSEGFALDGSGKAHPLIGNGSVTYALTPPP